MCSTLSIDSSRNKGSVCELNLLLVMILRAFFCNVNIRLHSKPQAVMQKYICGKIKELYIRLRICCGIDFFILFMMPIVFVILFENDTFQDGRHINLRSSVLQSFHF